MGFLRRVAVISFRDQVRSSDIREDLQEEPLLLCIERSQLRWFGYLVSWWPPCVGVSCMSSWEEFPGQTLFQVEISYLYTGLETPWDPNS